MIRILSIILPFLLFAINDAWGITTQIGSPWAAATINDAINDASDGDIIELTGSGTATWTATITIPNTKGLTFQVENGTNTPKDSANFPITATSNQDPIIQVNLENDNSVTRISGFKFQNTISSNNGAIHIAGRGTGPDGFGGFRIDNNYFEDIQLPHANLSGTITVKASTGVMYGVIDNNTLHDSSYTDGYAIAIWEAWKCGGCNWSYAGDDSWSRTFEYGGVDFVFIEDNLIENVSRYTRHYIVAQSAARYVARYNDFRSYVSNGGNDNEPTEAHGLCLCSNTGQGARGGEIYNNNYEGDELGIPINLRGGHWIISGNSMQEIGNGTTPIRFREYRAFTAERCTSTCDAVSGWVPHVTDDSDYPLPQQVSNTFVWGNTKSGTSAVGAYHDTGGVQSSYLQQGRDYFNSDDLADAITDGLDAGYTPFEYPHPLRGISAVTPVVSIVATGTPTESGDAGTFTISITDDGSGASVFAEWVQQTTGGGTWGTDVLDVGSGITISAAISGTTTLDPQTPIDFTGKTYGLNLVAPSGATWIVSESQSGATFPVIDSGSEPSVTAYAVGGFSTLTEQGEESGTIRLSCNSCYLLTGVSFEMSGTATLPQVAIVSGGTDYTGVTEIPATITLSNCNPCGGGSANTPFNITYTIVNDNVVDPDETIILTVVDLDGYESDSGNSVITITIIDNNFTNSGATPFNDEFNDGAWSNIWTWDVGVGPHAGVTREQNGFFEIDTGGGDIWNADYSPTLIYQSGVTGDFDVFIRLITSGITSTYQAGGIIFKANSGITWVGIQKTIYPSGVSFIQAMQTKNSVTSSSDTNDSGSTTFFRLRRVGSGLSTYYRDGTKPKNDSDWTLFVPSTKAEPSGSGYIGLIGNDAGGIQATIKYDYIRRWSEPVLGPGSITSGPNDRGRITSGGVGVMQ